MNKYTLASSAVILMVVASSATGAHAVTLPRLPSVVPSNVVLPTLPTLPSLAAYPRIPRFRGR